MIDGLLHFAELLEPLLPSVLLKKLEDVLQHEAKADEFFNKTHLLFSRELDAENEVGQERHQLQRFAAFSLCQKHVVFL